MHELRFPLFIVERSPLLTRDLDLLTAINQQSWVSVVLSISSLNPALKRAFEPHSPGVQQSLRAMAELADAGVLVGAGLMPVLPFIGDAPEQLEDVIKCGCIRSPIHTLVSKCTQGTHPTLS